MDDKTEKKSPDPEQPEGELDEQQLETVSGGVVKSWGLVVGTLDKGSLPPQS